MVTTDRTPAQRRAALPYGHTPMSEADVSAAWDAAQAITPADMSRRVSAMFILARGAGANGADMRYVNGEDVSTVGDAGTWVAFRRPGFERTVPVKCQFSQELQRLARHLRGRSLVGDRGQRAPVPTSCPEQLAEALQAEISKVRTDVLVTIERLRRAWLVEQLAGALPVRDFLQLTGERVSQSIRNLVDFCPSSPLEPIQLARLTGAVSDLELIDLETWGLD